MLYILYVVAVVDFMQSELADLGYLPITSGKVINPMFTKRKPTEMKSDIIQTTSENQSSFRIVLDRVRDGKRMDSNTAKLNILDRYKEEENDVIQELSVLEETELLRSPKFRRLRSPSPPSSNSSSPLKSNGSFENVPQLRFKPSTNQLLKTPTKSKPSNKQYHRHPLKPFNRDSPQILPFGSPTKLGNSKFNNLKVSLTPAQRLEKKPGKLFSSSDILSSYEFKETIGRGAFANVYRAINKITGDEVAVKEVQIEEEDDVLELMSEIDLLKILKHKNIVKYHGFVKNNKRLLIFLEYCSGGSLRTVYKKNGPLSEEKVVLCLRQVLKGLIYLHEQGVVHRDIKAANILLTSQGDIKLTDFGVSTKVSSTTIKTYSIAGTPNWMAPEIISMDGTSTASDIWSLGATVVELLTGEPLYAHLNEMAALHAIVTDDHPPLPENISSCCKSFLLKCFEKQPSERITATELLEHEWLQQKEFSSSTRSSEATLYVTEKQSKSIRNDFNSIKRFQTRNFLPLDVSYNLKRTDQEFDSFIERDLVDDFDALALTISSTNSRGQPLFEPLDKSNVEFVINSLRKKMIAEPSDITLVSEMNRILQENKAFTKIIIDYSLEIHAIQWIENHFQNENLCLEYLNLEAKIFEYDCNTVSEFLDYGGFITLNKLLNHRVTASLRVATVELLSLIFKTDNTYIKQFIRSGGLRVGLNLLQESYNKHPKLPLFIIDILYRSFEQKIVSENSLRLIVLNSSSTLDWIGVLLMELVHAKNKSATDKLIKILYHFTSSNSSSFKPLLLNSLFKVHEKLSIPNQLLVLKFIKKLHISEQPNNVNVLKFLVKRLKVVTSLGVRDNRILDLICSTIFSFCHLNHSKQYELIKLGALSTFQNLMNMTLPCSEYIIPLFCEFAFNSLLIPTISAEKDQFLQNYLELLLDPVWKANALDALLSLHEKIGTDDLVAKFLLNDKQELLLKSFLNEDCLNFDLYLERLIKFLSGCTKSMIVNQIRLMFFNSNDVIDFIFRLMDKEKVDVVMKINLFKLLKILTANNFIYSNYFKVKNHLKTMKPSNILLIEQLINEIVHDDTEKDSPFMKPPKTPNKLTFSES